MTVGRSRTHRTLYHFFLGAVIWTRSSAFTGSAGAVQGSPIARMVVASDPVWSEKPCRNTIAAVLLIMEMLRTLLPRMSRGPPLRPRRVLATAVSMFVALRA